MDDLYIDNAAVSDDTPLLQINIVTIKDQRFQALEPLNREKLRFNYVSAELIQLGIWFRVFANFSTKTYEFLAIFPWVFLIVAPKMHFGFIFMSYIMLTNSIFCFFSQKLSLKSIRWDKSWHFLKDVLSFYDTLAIECIREK